jgi:hypothetical protein
MLKTEYFNQYLDNNKIENIIFNKILTIGLGKKQKIELLSYYYENGNTVYIHKYKPFKSMELLYIELNKINKQYSNTHVFINCDYMNPRCLGTMELFEPIFKDYLKVMYNTEYDNTYNFLLITPLMELKHLVSNLWN